MCYRCGPVRPSDGPPLLRVADTFAYRVGPGTTAIAVDTGYWERLSGDAKFPEFDDPRFFELRGAGIVSTRFQKKRIRQERLKEFRRENRRRRKANR